MDQMKNFAEKIKDAGIIGGGGAGFPTHVKYEAKNVEYIIINGAECEPLLNADRILLETKAAQIIDALDEAVNFLKAKGGFIAVKNKKKNAIAAIQSELNKRGNTRVKIFTLDDFYPAGDEFVLTYEVLGRIVPEGGIPIRCGVIVNNVFTYVNIYNALRNIPVTQRITTVGGWVKEPYTAYFPIGTSVGEAIKLAGGAKGEDYKVIFGGPMMGKIINDLSCPITQSSSGIIVLPPDHVLIRRKERAEITETRLGRSSCDQCRMCTDVCPRYMLGHDLEPHMFMRAIAYKNLSSETLATAYLCCECNLCVYFGCPLFLSPGVIAANLKRELAKNNIKRISNKKDDEYCAKVFRRFRQIPMKRLMSRIGLDSYDNEAKLKDINYQPSEVRISLCAHIGKPSEAIVKIGEKVKCGDLIAKCSEGALGANIHASIDGKITQITDKEIIVSQS